MKNLKDPIGKRSCNIPACNAMPQPTALDVYMCVRMALFTQHAKRMRLCGLSGSAML